MMLMLLITSILIMSCKKNADNDGDNDIIPDLTFSWEVSGDVTRSESFMSPENNNTLGNHDHGLICTHTISTGDFTMIAQGSDYSFTINAEVSPLGNGSYTITNASFADLSSGGATAYNNVVNGTINITNARSNYVAGVSTFYDLDGNFTVTLETGNQPATSVTFSGSFTGLHCTST